MSERATSSVAAKTRPTTGEDRVPGAVIIASGTGELAGITGSGGLAIDADGTHRIWFDYELR